MPILSGSRMGQGEAMPGSTRIPETSCLNSQCTKDLVLAVNDAAMPSAMSLHPSLLQHTHEMDYESTIGFACVIMCTGHASTHKPTSCRSIRRTASV